MKCIVCDKKLKSKEIEGYNKFKKMCKEQKLPPPLPFCDVCYNKKGNILKILDEKIKVPKLKNE